MSMLILALLCGGNEGFQKQAAEQLDELERMTGETDQADPFKCKRLIRGILKEADSEQKREQLAGLFYDHLKRGSSLSGRDYFILWLGKGVLHEAPPESVDVLLRIADKIDGRRALVGREEEITNSLCIIAIEFLENRIDAPSGVSHMNGEIAWKEWDDYRKWLNQNAKNLEWSREEGKFIISVR